MPASTIIGSSISSMSIWMNSRVASPLFEPIGAPSGMTAAAPALARSRAVLRSGYIYGMTMKPSFARISVARTVSQLSGSRYLLSRIISILTKSPQPHSRASRAMRTASSAVRAPEVFGSSVTPCGICSRMLSVLELARRSAIVIICAPASETAALMSSGEYLPEPRIKRDVNSCPPMMSLSVIVVILPFEDVRALSARNCQ